MDWTSLLREYASAPATFWPPGQTLQATKLTDMVARRCSATGLQHDELLASVIDSARMRISARAPTMFLINCGSSGSHWLEAMLASLQGIRACGEVYAPPRASETFNTVLAEDIQGRQCFLDSLHQLHMETSLPAMQDDLLINSAHSWVPHDMMGETALTVFLVRDPLDVVASRTFRKPKLRRHVAPSSSDLEYLERGVAFVEKFYRSALRRKPQYTVRYEELRRDPQTCLFDLTHWLGRPTPRDVLAGIAQTHSAESQARSGNRLSNVHPGQHDTKSPQPLKGLMREAADRLRSIREVLGYA